ncbi:NACHT domain-containing protein [Neptunomonas japonica]|uniref:NACHT domain-containing protein n=1 Tax=Neptunomonas japonica TaxID=417574 RepID=UPI000427F836|nr:NACHT domain-containing protein [Neptunomonas japonica]
MDLSIAIFPIAKFISKSIFTLWVENDLDSNCFDFLINSNDASFDIAKDHVDNLKLAHICSGIEIEINESISKIIDIESYTEEEIETVVNAFKESTYAAGITKRFLLDIDYEAPQLEKKIIINKGPAYEKIYGDKPLELYKTLVSFYSVSLTASMLKLPEFKIDAIKEILKRSSEVTSLISEVLNQLLAINYVACAKDQSKNKIDFEKKYRNWVTQKNSKIDLYGVDLQESSKVHTLNVAYVSIRAKSEDDSGNNQSLPIERVLSKEKRILIRGLAGSGKTTILQWIAVNSASLQYRNRLSKLNNDLPFIIKLRDFHNKDFPGPDDFISSISSVLHLEEPEGWVRDKLNSGDAIILIDGVDELQRSKRIEVREWIEDLVFTYSECRFIVTSRPTAATKDWLKKVGFYSAELEEMASQHIDKFIDHWHAAVSHNYPSSEDRRKYLELGEKLKRTIHENRALVSLTNTPLLCGMICSLHKERRERLPEEKTELYEACIEMMLIRRNIERHISDDGYPVVPGKIRKRILTELADWFQMNGHSTAPKADVEKIIEQTIEVLSVKDSANEVLNLLLDRCGIIREPTIGYVDFTHKTFQEFLCAKRISERSSLSYLVSKCTDDTWHETVKMCVGLFTKENVTSFLEQLIKRASKEKTNSKKLILLSVSCLSETIYIQPIGIQKELKSQIKKIIPPKNLTEANSLASGKSLAVKELGDVRRFTKYKEVVACIRTLAKISSDESSNDPETTKSAIKSLSKLSNDTRKTVVDQLYKEWAGQSNIDLYFNEALKPHADKIISLNIENSEQLLLIQCFKNAKAIYISPEVTSADIDRLSEMKKLRSVSIYSGSKIDTFSNIELMESLLSLYVARITSSKIFNDSNCFKNCAILSVLIYNEFSMSDMLSFESLHELRLFGSRQVKFDNCFNNKLTFLRLFHVDNITVVNTWPTITELDITWCDFKDFSFIKQFPRLKKLIIQSDHVIQNIEFVRHLKELESLKLLCKFDGVDVSPLFECDTINKVLIPDFGIEGLAEWLDFKDNYRSQIENDVINHNEADSWAIKVKRKNIAVTDCFDDPDNVDITNSDFWDELDISFT